MKCIIIIIIINIINIFIINIIILLLCDFELFTKQSLQSIAKCWGWLTGLKAWGKKPLCLVEQQNNRSY